MNLLKHEIMSLFSVFLVEIHRASIPTIEKQANITKISHSTRR